MTPKKETALLWTVGPSHIVKECKKLSNQDATERKRQSLISYNRNYHTSNKQVKLKVENIL